MSDPAPVPSLDALADQPEAFDALPPATQAALLERAEVLAARLRVKLLAAKTSAAPATPKRPEEGMISLDAAAALVGRPRSWLLRRQPRPAWLKRVSGKTFVVDRAGLLRWLSSRPS